MRINERFSIAGAAGVLGLVFLLGLFGFLSLLGANPSKPLNSLRSDNEVVARQGPDEQGRSGTNAPSAGEPDPAATEQSQAANESPADATSPNTTPAAAVLAAVAAPRDARPTAAAQGQPQSTPARLPTPVPTPQATPPVTSNPTSVPTAPPITPTPQPEGCSTGGSPLIRETGKHVRLEYASVISYGADVLLVDVGGTVTVLRITASTVVAGNLSAATLVRAEGHREGDGSVTAELVQVLCPDSARG